MPDKQSETVRLTGGDKKAGGAENRLTQTRRKFLFPRGKLPAGLRIQSFRVGNLTVIKRNVHQSIALQHMIFIKHLSGSLQGFFIR